MTGPTHLLIGVTAYLIAEAVLPASVLPFLAPGQPAPAAALGWGLAAAAVGALLPDLDHPSATLAQLTVARIGRVRVRPLLPVALLMRALSGGHRKGTHTLWATAMLALGTLLALQVAAPVGQLLLALTVGYASHIAADMLTPSGCPVLYPLSRRNYHFLPSELRVRTGSAGESLLGAALLIGLGIGVFLLQYSGS